MSFRALRLGHPTEIEATPLAAMNSETYPLGAKIRFEFPARKVEVAAAHKTFFHRHDVVEQSPVTLWWYDGGQPSSDPKKQGGHDGSNKPPHELTGDIEAMLGDIPGSGALLLGDRGVVFSPDDYGEEFFVKLDGEKKFTHYKKHPAVVPIPQVIPRNPFKGDDDRRHHLEWIAAIKANRPENCYSRFAVGAQLTEIMLLGCVALRAGKKLEWDGPAMRATNAPEAAPFIRRQNRAGWKMAA
jgi:hypothetical protein